MTTRIDSVVQARYAESIRIDEEALGKVVCMLDLEDDERAIRAGAEIRRSLKDLATRRAQTVRAESKNKDRADLATLAASADSSHLTERVGYALDQLESLRVGNPVLATRLDKVLRDGRVHEWIEKLEGVDHLLAAFAQDIERGVTVLVDEIESENRRGRRVERAERAFAASLYKIWVEFTDRGTSRQNAYGRQRHPFGDFVDAAGKLLDPDFNGHDHARQVHEAARDLARESDGSGA